MSGNRYTNDRVLVWEYVSGTWTQQDRLVPQRATSTAGGLGAATFRLLRSARRQSDGTTTADTKPVVGNRIAITVGTDAPSGDANHHSGNVLWYGELDGMSYAPVIGSSGDQIGTATAVELGTVWDRLALKGWLRKAGTGTTVLENVPTANISTAGGKITGNKSGSGTSAVFESDPSDIGTDRIWSREELLYHAITNCVPSGEDAIQVDVSAGVLDQTDPEVYPLENLTLAGLLDMIAGESRGLIWFPALSSTSGGFNTVTIWIKQTTAAGSAVNIDETLIDLQTTEVPPYDEVVVEGGPIICCGTLSNNSGTLTSGWDSTAQSTFITGGADEANSKAIRGSSECADVFVRYRALPVSPNDYLGCDNGSGTAQSMCPEIEWNGTTATVGSGDRTPHLPSTRFLRWIPQSTGTTNTGTDTRSDDAKEASPQMPIRVFRDDGSNEYDLLNPPDRTWDTPTVSPDDRGPAVRIDYPYPEVLAETEWTGSPGPSPKDPTLTTTYEAGDWRDLYVTVAVESGQRLSISELRSGVTDPKRRLVIRRDDFQCWLIRSGTSLYVDESGSLLTATSNRLVRNDWAAAQTYLDQLADWAFLERSLVTMSLADVTSILTWGKLGYSISDINVQEAGDTVETITTNSVIRQVQWDFTVSSPRLNISTTAPVVGSGGGAGSGTASPTGGGPTSVSLGGTVPAVVRDSKTKQASERQDDARLPVSFARNGFEAGGASLDYTQYETGSGSGSANAATATASGLSITNDKLVRIYFNYKIAANDGTGDLRHVGGGRIYLEYTTSWTITAHGWNIEYNDSATDSLSEPNHLSFYSNSTLFSGSVLPMLNATVGTLAGRTDIKVTYDSTSKTISAIEIRAYETSSLGSSQSVDFDYLTI